MLRFPRFDEEKALATLLYVSIYLINKKIKADLHKIFKILYFADIRHLVTYGRLITSDYYIAMPDGPVPSQIYDIAKAVRGERALGSNYNAFFDIKNWYIVKPKEKPNMDELSKSDIECLNQSLEENQHLTYDELKKKSHDTAYELAKNNRDNTISLQDMAKAGGASLQALRHIKDLLETEVYAK